MRAGLLLVTKTTSPKTSFWGMLPFFFFYSNLDIFFYIFHKCFLQSGIKFDFFFHFCHTTDQFSGEWPLCSRHRILLTTDHPRDKALCQSPEQRSLESRADLKHTTVVGIMGRQGSLIWMTQRSLESRVKGRPETYSYTQESSAGMNNTNITEIKGRPETYSYAQESNIKLETHSRPEWHSDHRNQG